MGGVGHELAHLLLAAVARGQRDLDVLEQGVQRGPDLADLGALVGEALGHALGDADVAGLEGELRRRRARSAATSLSGRS